ncbi:MAG: hypothetical protein QOE82_1686 [Thermoanaerobaculia bacterium]|nr:hypothetical protein [Thermoanaerobaculia bacterium]
MWQVSRRDETSESTSISATPDQLSAAKWTSRPVMASVTATAAGANGTCRTANRSQTAAINASTAFTAGADGTLIPRAAQSGRRHSGHFGMTATTAGPAIAAARDHRGDMLERRTPGPVSSRFTRRRFSASVSSGRAMRITIIIPTLKIGGAERMAVHWANHWTAMGREVTIVTLDFEGQRAGFALDERVAVVNAPRPWWQPARVPEAFENLMACCTPEGAQDVRFELPLLMRIRDTVLSTRPDAVVGFSHLTSARTAAALWGSGVAVFATEHANPRTAIQVEFVAGGEDVYRLGGATVVALTQADLDILFEQGVAQGEVIFNPAMPAPVFANPATSRTIIALGRLESVKGFDILIDAFARVASAHPAWRLRICGDGRERVALQEMALRSGAPIEIAGATSDPFSEFAAAAIFALPSRSESFPVALLEAMACGLPVVASSCSAGVREIVRDGVDGLLVEPRNASALAEALKQLMSDAAERVRLGAGGTEVTSRFSMAEASARWDALLEPARLAASL